MTQLHSLLLKLSNESKQFIFYPKVCLHNVGSLIWNSPEASKNQTLHSLQSLLSR